MRKFLKAVILIPLGLLILVFAVANRKVVTFSLDPFGATDPMDTLVFAMPLFALATLLVIIGVLVGGIATWLRQGKWRRLARQREDELRTVRGENDRLKHQIERAVPSLAPPARMSVDLTAD